MIPIDELLNRFEDTKKRLMGVRMDLFIFSEFPKFKPPQFKYSEIDGRNLERIINTIDVVIEDLNSLIQNLRRGR